MRRRKRANISGTHCPHCNSQCDTMRTAQVTPLYREVVYQCGNDACGFTFVASITPVRAVIQSKTPNPEIRIPGTPVAFPLHPAPA